MKERLISFETAKLAKEFGFIGFFYDIKVYSNLLNIRRTYDREKQMWVDVDPIVNEEDDYEILPYIDRYPKDFYLAPTQSLLQKWLREKHKIIISIIFELNKYEILIDNEYDTGSIGLDEQFDDYEDALEYALKYSLTTYKPKHK